MLRCGNDPKFVDPQTLVSHEARICRSRFDKLAWNSQPHRSMRTPNWRQNLPKHHSDVLHFNAGGEFVPRTSAEICPVCIGSHVLNKCPRFLSTHQLGRWKTFKELKAWFACLSFGYLTISYPLSEPCSHPCFRNRYHPLLHVGDKQFNGRTTSNADREKRVDNRSTAFAMLVNQLANYCAPIPRSKCRISLSVLAVRIEGSWGYVETYASLDTGVNVVVVQKSILGLVGLRVSSTSLSITTVIGRAAWYSGYTE